MKILLDLQGAQTSGSRNRGIGRYSLSLAEAVIRNRGEHGVHILLNGAFGESLTHIHERIGPLIPAENFHVFEPLSPVRQAEPDNVARRIASELIREALISRIEADVVHVTSHFEGLGDEAVTSFGRLPSPVVSSVTFYDLIPHIHRQIYLENITVRSWYDERLMHLQRVDLLLSISESSRQEAIDYLGFDPLQVVNVSTAADPQFHKGRVESGRRKELLHKYGIRPRFVMYTGGIDYRKNLERLISAFASIELKVRANTSLAIVCSCNDHQRETLKSLAIEHGLSDEDFVMSGFVPDEDLIDLYRLAHHFVFPSWHEGFGLPALEAMSCGAPVIAGSRSSLPEVVGRADALFDPIDESAMTAMITRVLTDADFRKDLAGFAKRQALEFSWDRTAKKAIAAFEQSVAHKRAAIAAEAGRSCLNRPRLAYVSPLPPARSGIADYSAELITQLTRDYDIDVVIPQGSEFIAEIGSALISNVGIISPTALMKHAQDYTRIVYHFGNSDHHGHMVELIRSVPGVIVLHDFYLSGLFAVMQHSYGVPNFFDEAIYESHGYGALADANGRMTLQQAMWKYPCNLTVLKRSLGVIVHSNHSLDLARDWYGDETASKWRLIPHLRVPQHTADRESARKSLGIEKDEFVICSFGGIGETKRTDRLIEAFGKSKCGESAKVRLVIVGAYPQSDFGVELETQISSHPFRDRITVAGRVEREQYKTYLASADLAVQLRTLSRGETSGAVLDCLNWGVATIINANGSMMDIPDDCAFKLVDDFSVTDLARAIDRLVKDPEQRESIALNGAKLIRTRHDPRRCADAYRDAIEEFYGKANSEPSVIAARIGRTCGQHLSDADVILAAQQVEALPMNAIPGPVRIDVDRLLGSKNSSRSEALHRVRRLIADVEAAGRPSILVSRAEGGGWATRHDLALEALGLPEDLLQDHRLAADPETEFADSVQRAAEIAPEKSS